MKVIKVENPVVMEGNLKDRVNKNGCSSTLKAISQFENNKESVSSYLSNGYSVGENYFVAKVERDNEAKRANNENYKKHIADVASGNVQAKDKQEQVMADAYKAMLDRNFDNYVDRSIMDNAQDPVSQGGALAMVSTMAKMSSNVYKQEAKLGTPKEDKLLLIDDYLTAETKESYEYVPEIVYALQRKPNIFKNYNEVLNLKTTFPGSMSPLEDLKNNNFDLELRSIKTHSMSVTSQYNLQEQQIWNGYYGIDIMAVIQNKIEQAYNEFYHWNGIYGMFKNNKAFKTESVDRSTAGTYNPFDLVKITGLVGTDGKLAYDLFEIASSNNYQAIQKFIYGFSLYKAQKFGNFTMIDPVLVVPVSVYQYWKVTSFAYQGNLQMFRGYNNFLSFFEESTGIKVLPLNLIDPLIGSGFGDFSLASADTHIFYFYDRSQFKYWTTRSFKSISTGGWNTANGVDFTQVYEGEICDVFNPYFNENLYVDETNTGQNIPAVKGVLTGATNSNSVLDAVMSLNEAESVNANKTTSKKVVK